MKKFFYIVSCFILLTFISPYAQGQTKKESRKERKERIAKMVDDLCSKRDFFVAVTRLCPKNGVAQNVIYTTESGLYADFNVNRFSCELPYNATTIRSSTQAYSTNDNLHLSSKNQPATFIGGWQANYNCYSYRTVFWNNNDSEGVQAVQVTITVQIYRNGDIIMMAEWPGMEPMTYMGSIMDRPSSAIEE